MLNRKNKLFAKKKISTYKNQICTIGHLAWEEGLFPAYNGNISVKIDDDLIIITSSGTAKGKLSHSDISIMDKSGKLIEGNKLSTESFLHLNIYNYTNAKAIIHTHPAKLLALEVKNKTIELSKLPIYEAKMWAYVMGFVPILEPGSIELASAVSNSVNNLINQDKNTINLGAIWLSNHGLVAWAHDLNNALNLTEELEHLAEIALLSS